MSYGCPGWSRSRIHRLATSQTAVRNRTAPSGRAASVLNNRATSPALLSYFKGPPGCLCWREAVPVSHVAHVAMAGTWKVTRGQFCLHADCVFSLSISAAARVTHEPQTAAASSRASQIFQTWLVFVFPNKGRPTVKPSNSLGFQDSGQPPGPT